MAIAFGIAQDGSLNSRMFAARGLFRWTNDRSRVKWWQRKSAAERRLAEIRATDPEARLVERWS